MLLETHEESDRADCPTPHLVGEDRAMKSKRDTMMSLLLVGISLIFFVFRLIEEFCYLPSPILGMSRGMFLFLHLILGAVFLVGSFVMATVKCWENSSRELLASTGVVLIFVAYTLYLHW